jgi:aspartate aminotransferase-like enzyme
MASLATTVYHRTDEFFKIFHTARQDLKPIFGIADADEAPLILTASGSGAMEAAMVNLTQQGDEILVINGGKFSERWFKLGQHYGCVVHELKLPWGQAPEMVQIADKCSKIKDLRAVFWQANETSTGVRLPVQEIAETVRKCAPNALTVVDAISSLGAHPMKMTEWQLDCVVAGSQKGFGIPPGLSFIAVSKRAVDGFSKRPRFYFDLTRELKEQRTGSTAWTPAISLVLGLAQALKEMNTVGIDRVVALHEQRANAVRAAVSALGLRLLPEKHASNALSAILLPEHIPGKTLEKRLRERFGFIFAGGQDQMAGKLLRFSHLGFVDRFDILAGIAAIEFVLHEMGQLKELGKGVSAAMTSFSSK